MAWRNNPVGYFSLLFSIQGALRTSWYTHPTGSRFSRVPVVWRYGCLTSPPTLAAMADASRGLNPEMQMGDRASNSLSTW